MRLRNIAATVVIVFAIQIWIVKTFSWGPWVAKWSLILFVIGLFISAFSQDRLDRERRERSDAEARGKRFRSAQGRELRTRP